MQRGWKEVLRIYAPSGTRRTKVEFQQVSLDDSFYLAMISHRVDLQLDNAEDLLSENMFEVSKTCYEVTVYHVDCDESEFVYTPLPPLEIDKIAGVELKYKLVVAEECLYLVPIHSRTVCPSAKAYRYDEGKDCMWYPVSLSRDVSQEITQNMSGLKIDHAAESKEAQREVKVHSETGDLIPLKKAKDEPAICNVIMSPGGSLPISLRASQESHFNVPRWRKPLEPSEIAHTSLTSHWHELEERSALAASGDHGVLYQTRIKGPYITELWSYDVLQGIWKPLPPPPVNQCLQVAVCRLSLQRTSGLKSAHFEPEDIADIPLPKSPYENKDELGLYSVLSYFPSGPLSAYASKMRKGSLGFEYPPYAPEFNVGPQDENLLLGDELNFAFDFDGVSVESFDDEDGEDEEEDDHDY